MCTVTYIPNKNKVFITSNRDEKKIRARAVPPDVYNINGKKTVFPKDADAGGTWIAANKDGNSIVFLNGAFVKHELQPPYRKSRGLILLDLVSNENPYKYFLDADLFRIEPFTAILFQNDQLFECRWDGKKKYHVSLDPQIPHIWSSVTLYDTETVKKREKWFRDWLANNPSPFQNDILDFHQFTGDGDHHNDLLMNRDGLVFTVSITSLQIQEDEIRMKYLDINTNEIHLNNLPLNKAITT